MQVPKKPERVNVVLTLPEVDIVLQSMGGRPYDLVADLIANIRSQVIAQFEQLNRPEQKQQDGTNTDAVAGAE